MRLLQAALTLGLCAMTLGSNMPAGRAAAAEKNLDAAPLVTIETGRLAGRLRQDLASGATAAEYKGIPFAAPPVGDLRWRPPAPAVAWTGTRESVDHPNGCFQARAGFYLPWTAEFVHQGPISEDCLNLNIWTPAARGAKPLPVIVFVHGGGFFEGSNAVPVYDGAALAAKGVIVVIPNYRLGVLGFLAHPDFAKENPQGASGNYGLMDQVAALQWVRRNIAAFGGDPARVILAGQSSGSMSAYMLSASPLARGLFRGIISDSGAGSVPTAQAHSLTNDPAQQRQVAIDFAARRRVSTATELRALTLEQLSPMVMADGTPEPRARPTVDGRVLPDYVDTIYARGGQIDVPLLAGLNSEEGDERAVPGLVRLLEDRAKTGKQPAYAYRFVRGIPWPEHPAYGAFHTSELVYTFDNLGRLNRPWQVVDHEVARIFSRYWVNFAYSLDPNGPDVPSWDRFVPGVGNLHRIGAP